MEKKLIHSKKNSSGRKIYIKIVLLRTENLKNMIIQKSREEIELMRESALIVSKTLGMIASEIKEGVTTLYLDKLAEEFIRDHGAVPSFLGLYDFPNSLCMSPNAQVVHGIPNERKLQNGDIVGLDLGIIHGGLFTDMAMTVPIGEVDKKALKLIEVTNQALEIAISSAQAGFYTGDIGYAVEYFIKKHKYGIVRELSGHGVGYQVHEPPYVPNYGKPGKGVLLKPGMVLALEPMINEGGDDIVLDDDDFTYKTKDGGWSAHFEKTIVITENGPEILTP